MLAAWMGRDKTFSSFSCDLQLYRNNEKETVPLFPFFLNYAKNLVHNQSSSDERRLVFCCPVPLTSADEGDGLQPAFATPRKFHR
jgi:hypothetical protein